MPTSYKRINLTVPTDLYAVILRYKETFGIKADSDACMRMILAYLLDLHFIEVKKKAES